MNNSAILAKLATLGISLFGAMVYEKREVIASNVTGTVEKSQFGQDQLVIKSEASEEHAYVRLGRGVDPKKTSFEITRFEATRDASGKTASGQSWAVSKGKSVAYAM